MTLFRSLLSGARGRRRTPASLALAVMAAMTVAAVVAAQSDLDTPSPATGTAQVIAQGMTARPDLRTAWRIVQREIPVRADARPSDRLEGSAGFLLADKGAIFVTDQDTKQRYRLAPGEAQFVPIGANQTWASLETKPTTAYTIELAVRDNVNEAAEGKVIYKSGSFGMAEGDYDLDLLRDTQPYNERTNLGATAFPTLIFVTQGQLEVSSTKKGVETQRLTAGEAGAFEGDLTLRTRSKGDAAYVAAVVSASLGGGRTSTKPTEKPSKKRTPTPTQVPESRTGSAELRLEVKLCPAGMRPETLDTSQCRDAEGGYSLALITPFGDTLRLRDANRADPDYIRWSNLKAGEYQLVVRTYPDGYDASSLDGYVCCTEGGGYSIRFTRGATVVGTLYFFPPE